MEFDKETSEAMTRLAEGAAEKIEQDTVKAYKAIEHGTVGTYKKIEDAFVDSFLKKDGESIEDAKARLAAEQKAREAKMYHPTPKSPLGKDEKEDK